MTAIVAPSVATTDKSLSAALRLPQSCVGISDFPISAFGSLSLNSGYCGSGSTSSSANTTRIPPSSSSFPSCGAMPVTTRAMAARQAAGGHGRPSTRHNDRAPATPPRSATRTTYGFRGFPSHGRNPEASDDEDDEDEDDESDDDTAAARSARVAHSMRLQMRALEILSVFEPDGLFINEAWADELTGVQRSVKSQRFRNAMRILCQGIRTDQQFAVLEQQIPITTATNDTFWAEQTRDRIADGMHEVMASFRDAETDAIATLTMFRRVFCACLYLFMNYPTHQVSDYAATMVVTVIHFIVGHDRDVRSQHGHYPTYVGPNVYNIYRYFCNTAAQWEWFIATLDSMIAVPAAKARFVERRNNLIPIIAEIRRRHEDSAPEEPEFDFSREMVRWFNMVFAN